MASTDFTIRILGDASGAQKAVDQFSGRLETSTSGWSTKSAAAASAIGNVAADVISELSSTVVSYIEDAAAASDATAKFADTLQFAGLDTGKIDDLKQATQEYADDTVYNLSDIQTITATLASNGVEGYDTLAMALGNLNAVAGGNAETFGRVGSVLTQTAGQGKLTTENWNQLTDAIPGASGKLQQALEEAGAFTGNFREAMEQGEITADEFNAAIQRVGSDPIAVEAAKSVETFEGAQGNLAAAIQSQLVKAIDLVKPAFTGLQNGIAWFVQNSGLLVPTIAGVGAALITIFAPAIWAAVTATWDLTTAMLANPFTWIVLAIAAVVAGIVWLATQTTFFQDAWTAVTQAVGDAATWLWESVLEPVFTAIGDVFSWIYNYIILPVVTGIMIYIGLWAAAFTWLWDTVLAPVFGFIGTAFQVIYEGVIVPVVGWIGEQLGILGTAFGILWTGFIQPALDAIGVGLQWVWNSIISPVFNAITTAVTWVGDTIRAAFTGIGDFIGTAFNTALEIVRGPLNAIIDLVNTAIGGLNAIRVDIPEWVPMVGGQVWGLNIPTIPRLATGTVTSGPMFALIGDNPGGREVVAPYDSYVDEIRRAAGVGQNPAAAATSTGPMRLAREDLDYLAEKLSGQLHDSITTGAKRATLRLAGR